MKSNKLFKAFLNSERSGGVFLIFCTIFSLFVANSRLGKSYQNLWQTQLSGHSIEHWINDGLMAIFFFLIGLELKREIYRGELANINNALLPIVGAVGGMLIPAVLFLLVNFGTPTQSGAGIPMATDIAFALAVLSLLGNKTPQSLKVFLTALAVIDDVGAILVIAIFYTKTLIWINLCSAFGIWFLLFLLGKLKVNNLILYMVGGVAMWFFMHNSGVHATLAGVLLAFAIPFGNGNNKSMSTILQHLIHKPVAFIILPLFALVNTAIIFNANSLRDLTENYSIGVALGLLVGKPLGIFVFCFISIKIKLCKLPIGLKWINIVGVGVLGGIGFTMSIFITLLAYNNMEIIDNTKLAILLSSVIAGIVGYLILQNTLKPSRIPEKE